MSEVIPLGGNLIASKVALSPESGSLLPCLTRLLPLFFKAISVLPFSGLRFSTCAVFCHQVKLDRDQAQRWTRTFDFLLEARGEDVYNANQGFWYTKTLSPPERVKELT
jgi:hypothetical protein